MAEKFAVKGWHLAQKQGGVWQQQRRHYSTGASRSSVPVELLTGGVLPPRLAELKERLAGFMADHVFPVESQLEAHQSSAQRWTVSPIIEDLKVGGAWCVWPVSAVCVCVCVCSGACQRAWSVEPVHPSGGRPRVPLRSRSHQPGVCPPC